jgi:type IX secretion system PorP/SprF family membrane protein
MIRSQDRQALQDTWRNDLRCAGLLLMFFACLVSASAQQVPQYLYTPFTLVEANPAVAGLDGNLVLIAGLRRQWNALPGQPEGFHTGGHIGLPFISSGAGISIQREEVGLLRFTALCGHYSYHYPLSRKWILAGGLSAGFLQGGLDGTGIRTPGGQYPVDGGLDHQDDRLPTSMSLGQAPLLHLGLALQGERLTAGMALRQVNGGRLRFRDQDQGIALRPHLYMHASYRAGSGLLEWQPMIQGRADGSEWQIDGLLLFHWKNRFILGGGFRGATDNQRDAWVLSAGLRFSERFLLIYAFEQGISPLNRVHQGSFELMLRYDLEVRAGRGILPPRIHTPRFL